MTRWLAIAHRAGNDLDALRAAESLGVDLVEADVRLFRRRLEVRHLKTVGPIPILWDRWVLASPFGQRLTLDELLAHAAPETELMLDLKGRSRRMPALVAAALERTPVTRVTICARHWPLLEPFAGRAGVRVVRSVGTRRQLARLLAQVGPDDRLPGVSIHARLLDAGTVRVLRARTEVLMCWGVGDRAHAEELRSWGVNGIIATDRELLDRIAQAVPG